MHLRSPHVPGRPPGYPSAHEKAIWALECVQGRHGLDAPDFVLSAGDIINGEIPDYGADFDYLKASILDRLSVPFLPCVGNHENGQGEGMAQKNLAYDACFGPRWHNYVFTCRGIGFVVVDTSGGHRPPDEVTAARNAFVARALDRLGGRPILLVSHIPLIVMREEAVLKTSFGFSSWKVLDTRLLQALEEHADRIIAVLSGHIHLTSVRRQGRIYHIMPGGLCGYPSDFASLDVFADRIEVRMHRAPAQWLDRAGNIHGRPRHAVDYTDGEHPDHERYLWGNEQERSLTIPLNGKKRLEKEWAGLPLKVFHEIRPDEWEEAVRPWVSG